jgi:hypothetical protein
MRSTSIFAVSIAFATCAFLYPNAAQAKTSNATAHSISAGTASQEAAQMVPAQAVLAQSIDAKKMQSGQQFQAKLSDTVHLKNGVELPKGTTLVGTVATDKMGVDGKSTLALRFTKADLKDGKAIPIEATIIGVAPPAYGSSWDGSGGQAPPSAWNGKTLQIDEIGVMSGVDLHSKIASRDSGVFVSSKKDNMKFSNQSQLSLAIAPRATSEMRGGA